MIDSEWSVDRAPADRAAGPTHGDALRACLGCPPAAKGTLVARSSRRTAASRARGAVRIGGDPEPIVEPSRSPPEAGPACVPADMRRLLGLLLLCLAAPAA